jgi:hypothetical protein
MVKAFVALLGTYLTLKLIQYAVGGQPGYRDADPTLREQLLRGEPILFAVAFALSVPAALWSNWYFHRLYTRGLEASTDCYGKLRALNELPAVSRSFDPYTIFDRVGWAEQTARISGDGLGLQPAVVSKALADRARLFSARYAALAREGDRRKTEGQTAKIKHCLLPNL